MSKLTARLLVVGVGLVAAILACQLPGAKGATTTATASAPADLTPTSLAVVAPPAGTGAPTQAAAATATAPAGTPSDADAFTSVAQTQAAQTATAGAAAAQASPPSVVLTRGAGGAPRQMNLAFDGKGTLHLWDVGSGSGGLQALFHQQRGADGAWTKPGQVADKFMALVLGPLPDPNNGCLLWGGQYNSSLTGVFLNCPNGDGSWPDATDPIYKPLTQQGVWVLAAAGGPNSTAGALYVSPVKGAETLFYSPINLMLLHSALAANQVSKGQAVLEAELVLDAKGGIHALWLENSGSDTAISILASYSSDQGKTWSAPEKLYSGTADDPSRLVMQLAADPAGNVHAAWEGDRKIIYRHWTAAGGWGDVVVISGDNVWSVNVRLAVTAGGLARAIWSTVKNPQVVYAAQAPDGSWKAPQPVAIDQASDLALAVDAKGGNHVVWSGQADTRYATWMP